MANPDTESLFFPAQASTLAPDVDRLFYFILTLCVIFFVLIIAGGIYFVVKYRHRPGGPEAVPISHNTALEVAWSVIPLFLLFIMFAWGYRGYLNAAVAPRDAIEIQVRGQKWSWEFTYPGDISTTELVVPVNKPVKLIMAAKDVLHSFYIPAFRLKQDVVPNRYTTLWFQATQKGDFQVFCAEYCGKDHSAMLTMVRVRTDEEYLRWLDEQNKPPAGMALSDYGKKLFTERACVGCHAVAASGGPTTGPSLWQSFGRQEKLIDGSTVTIDENYLRESILRPAAKVVANFGPTSTMPPFEGSLKDFQIDALIAYIKSLK